MIFSDRPSPAEAGFAKAGNRFPLFGIMRYRRTGAAFGGNNQPALNGPMRSSLAAQHSAGSRGNLVRAAALLIAAALGGCSSISSAVNTGAPESEDAIYAGSPANIESLTDVVRRNPNDPQAYNMRGSVLGESGRYPEALADFNKAIGIDPNYAQAYANRGLVYRETGKLDL